MTKKRNNLIKRITSITLMLCLLFAFLSFSVSANDENITCGEETIIQNTAFENLKTILPKNDEELELVFEGDYKGKKITLSFSYAKSGYNGAETIGVTVKHEGETLFLTLLLIKDDKAVLGVHNEELTDIAFLDKKDVIFNEEISLTWGTTNVAESLQLSTPELNEKVEEQLKDLLLILQNFLHKSNIDATIQELGFENAKTEIVIDSNGDNLCIPEHEKDKYSQGGANVEDNTRKIYVYALDGRIEHIDEKDKDAFLAVGWYSEPMMYVYATDGRKQPIPTRQLEDWIAVGWYDSPTIKIGELIGHALTTDIVATINGYDIPSYNVDGYTYIVAEDLKYYGFNVWYDDTTRTLFIERDNTQAWVSKSYVKPNISSSQIGKKAHKLLYTDIKTYIGKNQTPGYNINGQTIIKFDSLAAFGGVSYDNSKREISLSLSGLNYNPNPVNRKATSNNNQYTSSTYPGTTLPTYTSVTGVRLKEEQKTSDGDSIYVYTYTGSNDVSLYWKKLLSLGWAPFQEDSAYTPYIYESSFYKGDKFIIINVYLEFNEIWITY